VESPLVAGYDYPNTYRGFVEMFPDNASCAAYLIRLRWPNGFICPTCKMTTTPRQGSRGRLTCPLCRNRIYAQAGTIFDKTRTPLTTWFEAAWHIMHCQKRYVGKNARAYPGNKLPCSLDHATTFSGCHGGYDSQTSYRYNRSR